MNGAVYKGKWEDGRQQARERCIYVNVEVYDGECHLNGRHG